MRVLWFPGNGAMYANLNRYNGGGWTGALARKLSATHPEIELGMAIPWDKYLEDNVGNIKIYGVPRIKHAFVGYRRKLLKQTAIMQKVVDDFHPDIIHVFGSEHTGGMVATLTDIPVVLHLQGIMNFLGGAWLPQNMSWGKMITYNPKCIIDKTGLARQCSTERIILKSCKYFMGRTEMDKRVSSILSSGGEYFYCSEMLRPEIYYSEKRWSFHHRDKIKIVSVISSPLYKGGDVLLRTARILKEEIKLDFEWDVYGVTNLKYCERLSGINTKDVDVNMCGVVNAEELVDAIVNSDVFVHPSYIENSPNTVCEAQLLGIPVIANYVGGISSIIKHMENGVLLPANDPYMTASYIKDLINNETLALKLGTNGRKVALERHSPESIVKDVISVYEEMLQK